MNLETKLESLLFFKGEPISLKKICTALECTEDELNIAIESLEKNLENRGIKLMKYDGELELRTASENSDLIVKLTKEELIKDLGKAGLETLAIILYKSPIKRSEIDYIRGVNSSFIVRNLLVRGLIERITSKEGEGRGFMYKPTIDLLAHLGIAKLEDLPEYENIKKEIDVFEEDKKENTE